MEVALLHNKNKRRGLIATLLLHALLALLFVFYGLTYTFPPPEQGILINFGSSDEGVGKIQPDRQGSESEKSVQGASLPEEQHHEKENEDASMTTEESSLQIPVETEEEKQKRLAEEQRQREEEAFRKQLEDTWNKAEQQGGSEGETGKPGDQGDPQGSKTSKSHIGGPMHGRGNYKLNGRSLLFAPLVREQSQKEGVVVVSIIVDKKGNVIEATPGVKGTTTTDSHLWKVAREAALKYRFNANLYAPEEQMGQISFTFVLK